MAMPKLIQQSISILSDAGLGMAMFSLGNKILRIFLLEYNNISTKSRFNDVILDPIASFLIYKVPLNVKGSSVHFS